MDDGGMDDDGEKGGLGGRDYGGVVCSSTSPVHFPIFYCSLCL